MKRDYFLIGILAGILLLVAGTIGLYFLRQGGQEYVSDATPEGVVRNYGLALLQHDYARAYSFLADEPYKPTYAEFNSQIMNYTSDSFALQVGTAQVNGQEASVPLQFINISYGTSYPNMDTAHLVLQDGRWKLDQMNYYLWGYGWFQPTPAP
jgi:hypothetical protein